MWSSFFSSSCSCMCSFFYLVKCSYGSAEILSNCLTEETKHIKLLHHLRVVCLKAYYVCFLFEANVI
jgi:hypothetical protein